MAMTLHYRCSLLLPVLLLAGCGDPSNSTTVRTPAQGGQTAKPAATVAAAKPAETKITKLGENVYLGIAGDRRWVEIHATVCLQQGFLEHLLSITEAQKQHESILTASFDAANVHAGLLATGAKPGRPVQFYNAERKPDFRPPTGQKVKVTLRYKDKDKDGKEIEVPAQRWVRNTRTKKELDLDWVFAGSYLDEQREGVGRYGANDGRVICVSNFVSAMLDLPVKSDEGDPQGGLEWEANPEQIPPRDTKVIVILEPKKE